MNTITTTRFVTSRAHVMVATIVLLFAGLLLTPAASAQCPTPGAPVGGDTLLDQVCMEELAGFGLNCTANDIEIASVTDIVITDDGCAFPGDTVEFSFTAEVFMTAQNRHDIGIYFATDGDPNADGAITGECSISTLPYAGTFEYPDTSCGDYTDLDGTNDDPNGLIQDDCGDITAGATTNPLYVTIGPIVAECVDADDDGNLDLPNCTSWRQPGANDLCTSPLEAFPGAPSKCRCDAGFNVPIEVPDKFIEIVKDLEPDADPGLFDLQLDGTTIGNDQCLAVDSPWTCCTGAGTGICADASDVNDGGATGPIAVDEGLHSVGELAGTNTDLGDYDTSIECVERGTATIVASCTDCTSLDVDVPVEGADWVCTITNTRRSTDLAITKVDDVDPIQAGNDLTYTITVANDCVDCLIDAENVVVTDTLPAGVTYLSDTDSCVESPPGTLTCSLGTVVAGTTASFDVTVNVNGDVPDGTILLNTAVVSSDTPDDNPDNDTDDEETTVENNPAIDIVKTGALDLGGDGVATPGDLISYTFDVTNTGNMTLTDVTVTDPLVTNIDCGDGTNVIGTMEPLDTAQCTGTYAIDQADIDAGVVSNTATVTGDCPDGTECATDEDSHDEPIVPTPGIDITKTADPTTANLGDTVTFTIRVENTGNVTLYNVVVSDPLAPACDMTFPSLAPGAVETYTCDLIVTEELINVATVTGDCPPDYLPQPEECATDEDEEPVDAIPTIAVVKTADPTFLLEPGGTFTFSITVNNTSPNEAVDLFSLVDDIHGDLNGQGDCSVPQTIAAGGSYSCSFDADVTGNAGYSETDVVTAQARDDEGNEVSANDDATVLIRNVPPGVGNEIVITKTADPVSVPEPGGDVTFTVVIENQSTFDTMTVDSLVDDIHGDLNGQGTCSVPQVLAPGANYTCSFTANVSGNAGDTEIDTVTATGVDDDHTPEDPSTFEISDDATVTISETDPIVRLEKSADPLTLAEPGGLFAFTLTVYNDSSASDPLTIDTLTDSNSVDAVDFSECAALVGTTLQPGTSASCTYQVEHLAAGTYPNDASVSATDDDGTTVTDDASASVSVTDVAPVVDLVKSAVPTTLAEPGGDFVFTLTITNNSNASDPIEITDLTDTQSGATDFSACAALIGAVLQPGESTSCNYTVNHTQAGTYDNTASVSAVDDEGTPASDTADATVEVTDAAPVVDLTKTVTPASLSEPGGDFVFTLTITNNSNASDPIEITDLTDTQSGATDFSACAALIGAVLQPGESTSCNYTVNHTQAGTYDNTASVSAVDDEGTPASDTADATVEVTDAAPVVDLTKTVTPASLSEPGGDFVFTLTITNNSNASDPIEITDLTDTQSGATDFSACAALIGAVLQPGESTSCNYTVNHTQAGTYDNTASVSAVDDEGTPASDTADATVEVTDAAPVVDLTKTVTPASLSEPGGDFVFTLTITNNSNASDPIEITDLTDTQSGATDFSACAALIGAVLQPGESTSCNYTVNHTQAGTYDNTASVSAVDDEGTPASDTADATVEVTDAAPVVDLTKTVTPASLSEPGGDFVFTLTITNNSNASDPIEITDLTDTQSGATDFSACAALIGAVLQPGESTSCNYTVNHTQAGTYDNTASVSAVDDEGTPASDTADATVEVTDAAPVVDLTKTVTPASLSEPGGDFVFTLTITNNSNASDPIEITDLTDTQSGATDFSACAALIGAVLQPGESTSCNYTVNHTQAGTYDNTASVSAVDDEGTPASDTADATVEVTDAAPVVDLTKTVTPASLSEPGGDFVFTLTITNNSNASDPIEITDLTDTQSGATDFSACAALIGAVLQPGESTSCNYTVNHTQAGTYDNTASVSAVDDEGTPASDTADATVEVTDAAPVVDLTKTVTPASLSEPGGDFVFTLTITNNSNASDPIEITDLTDTQSGATDFSACAALIGAVLQPGESTSCNYTVNHTQAGTYDNTASVSAVDDEGTPASDTADATVEVTDAAPVVDLTKTVTPASLSEPGGDFVFTLTITNNSNASDPIEITDLTDTQSGATDFSACAALIGAVLQPGESTSCNYTVNHTQAGTYDNTASVSAVDDEGTPASDTADATVEVTDAAPVVDLTKSAVPTILPEPGGPFVFTLTITNNSNAADPVTITSLTDSNSGLTDFTACAALIGATLLPGESTSCQYTVIYGIPAVYPNTANVSVVDDEGTPATDDANASVAVTDVLPVIEVTKTATPEGVVWPGEDVTFTILITNLSNAGDPVTITDLTDTVYGDLLDSLNPDITNNTCDDAAIVIPGNGGTFECSFDAFIGPIDDTIFGEHTNVATADGQDDEGNPVSDDDDATVTISPPIAVTDSSLCMFDRDLDADGRQFRRLFTPNVPNYKLTATNPGQFFYNLSVSGTYQETKTITLEVPWTFVTQGARPVHVYDGLSFRTNEHGELCFVPGGEVAAIDEYIVLSDYGVAPGESGYDPHATVTIQLEIPIPMTGFAYVNQHLDDGLKGQHTDFDGDGTWDPQSYQVNSNNDATQPSTGDLLIPNLAWHEFCTYAGASTDPLDEIGCDSVQNFNEFKRNPGVAGRSAKKVKDEFGNIIPDADPESGEPVMDMWVKLYKPRDPKKGCNAEWCEVGRAKMDQDGYYQIVFKHKGKPTDYRLAIVEDETSDATDLDCENADKRVNLKGNEFEEVNFHEQPDTCKAGPSSLPGGF